MPEKADISEEEKIRKEQSAKETEWFLKSSMRDLYKGLSESIQKMFITTEK